MLAAPPAYFFINPPREQLSWRSMQSKHQPLPSARRSSLRPARTRRPHEQYPAAVLAIIVLLMPFVVLTSQGRFTASGAVPAINNPAQEASGWRANVVEKRKPNSPLVTLRKIRAGRHASFDRVVFEFTGGAVPGYHIEYVDRPVRQCGSGDTVKVAGDGWLSVRLTALGAHRRWPPDDQLS